MAEFQSWSSDQGNGYTQGVTSPGGFEFGVCGWMWSAPIPSSVTFYLDNTASVFDQYGRPIKGVVTPDGKEVRFATTPPKADDADVVLRRIFARHAEVVEMLLAEGIDIIKEMNSVGTPCLQCRGTARAGDRPCSKCRGTGKRQTVVCSGWPQLPYEQLKRLDKVEWPFSRAHNSTTGQRCGCVNCSIRDPQLRKDALKLRAEAVAAQQKEHEGMEVEGE